MFEEQWIINNYAQCSMISKERLILAKERIEEYEEQMMAEERVYDAFLESIDNDVIRVEQMVEYWEMQKDHLQELGVGDEAMEYCPLIRQGMKDCKEGSEPCPMYECIYGHKVYNQPLNHRQWNRYLFGYYWVKTFGPRYF